VSEQERRWVTVAEFAAYLGISSVHAYRLVARDPAVKQVSRRFGRRVLVCLAAWQQGEEARMTGATGPFPRIVHAIGEQPRSGRGV
jgi:hypothetical protein